MQELQKNEKENDVQAGISAIDNIFYLSQVIEERILISREVHLLLVHLIKAYHTRY